MDAQPEPEARRPRRWWVGVIVVLVLAYIGLRIALQVFGPIARFGILDSRGFPASRSAIGLRFDPDSPAFWANGIPYADSPATVRQKLASYTLTTSGQPTRETKAGHFRWTGSMDWFKRTFEPAIGSAHKATEYFMVLYDEDGRAVYTVSSVYDYPDTQHMGKCVDLRAGRLIDEHDLPFEPDPGKEK